MTYVTLLTFKGAGRVIEAYLDPAHRSLQPLQQAQVAVPVQETPVLRKELIARLQTACRRLRTSANAVLAEHGRRQFVELDDLDLTRIVLGLEGRTA